MNLAHSVASSRRAAALLSFAALYKARTLRRYVSRPSNHGYEIIGRTYPRRRIA